MSPPERRQNIPSVVECQSNFLTSAAAGNRVPRVFTSGSCPEPECVAGSLPDFRPARTRPNLPPEQAPDSKGELIVNRDGSRVRRCVSALLLASLLLLPAANCYAWGAGGHMIVAYIAYQRLNSNAKREVNR